MILSIIFILYKIQFAFYHHLSQGNQAHPAIVTFHDIGLNCKYDIIADVIILKLTSADDVTMQLTILG